MDIRQLRTFIQVAEVRSISRAAVALHIAQPALSRQIKQLEEELGDSLFERTERGVTLTPLGEEILHRAANVVREFDSLRTDLSRRSTELSGNVRFGAPKTLMESYVAPALVNFHLRYPGISILAIEGTTLELREQIHSGSLDLAIVSDLDRSPGARMQPLFREPLVLASHPSSQLRMSRPVSASVVARHKLITPNRPNVVRLTLDEVLHREGLSPQIGMESSSHVTIRALASAGAIHGVLPYSSVASDLQLGRLTAAPVAGAFMAWHFILTPLRQLPRQAVALHSFMTTAAEEWVKCQHALRGIAATKA